MVASAALYEVKHFSLFGLFTPNTSSFTVHFLGDLVKALKSLYKRIEKFDGVIIETTGLADPGE